MKSFLLPLLMLGFLTSSAQNVGIGTNNPLHKLHVNGSLFVNSSVGEIRFGYPGEPANYLSFTTIGGGADLKLSTHSETGVTKYPFYFSQAGNLGINLDTNSGVVPPLYSLHVAARNKYGIYSSAKSFNSDTVAAVYGYLDGSSLTPFSAAVRGESNSTSVNGIGVLGIQKGGGWGVAGFAKELGFAGYGAGIYGSVGRGIAGGTGTGGYGVLAENYNASGVAGAFRNYAGVTGKALQTSGAVQMTGIGEGAGKVLTSDATGNATWQAAPLYFVHKAVAANTTAHITTLSYPNALQTDILIVTHNYNPVGGPVNYNSHPYGVYWTGSAWTIYNEDIAAIVNTAWNVVVARQ